MKLIVVLDNIRSAYNVGAILRTCEGFGIDGVYLSGYTPRVHDSRLLPHLREKLDREIHKTALGAEDMLKIYSSDDILSDLRKLRDEGWQICGLENNITDDRLHILGESATEKLLGEKIVLVLGEEVHGINYSLYDIFSLFLEIPMRGKKESFNVSVAAGVAIWELTKNRVA